MSTASQQSRPSTVECRNPACDEYGPRWEYIENEFCSHHCRIEKRGHDALRPIRYDHRFCYTCGTQLKSVEQPPDDFWLLEAGSGWTRDDEGRITLETYGQDETQRAVIGYQYLKPTAYIGERTAPSASGVKPEPVTMGTVCRRCGSTTPNQSTPELFAHDPERYARRLLDTLERETDTEVDRERFGEAFDGENLPYAVGKSVRGDRD